LHMERLQNERTEKGGGGPRIIVGGKKNRKLTGGEKQVRPPLRKKRTGTEPVKGEMEGGQSLPISQRGGS